MTTISLDTIRPYGTVFGGKYDEHASMLGYFKISKSCRSSLKGAFDTNNEEKDAISSLSSRRKFARRKGIILTSKHCHLIMTFAD